MTLVQELGFLFREAGFSLFLVGGSVRDRLLGRESNDLDFTTEALPDQIWAVVKDWADSVFDVGMEFGTVGLSKGGEKIEITTFRQDTYDHETRRPKVVFGTDLVQDLARRDFRMNAIAQDAMTGELIDPFRGQIDLYLKVLDTPGQPWASFKDDPLRMLRAVRFEATLGFEPSTTVQQAIINQAETLKRVSAERIQVEFTKILLAEDPSQGLHDLCYLKLADQFLPELASLYAHHSVGHKPIWTHSLTVLKQAIDQETDGPDLILRLAALFHDIGKPSTLRHEDGEVTFNGHEVVGARIVKDILTRLRYPHDVVDAVELLVRQHMRAHDTSGWSDGGVRRFVVAAGAQLDRLNKLVRADATTRHQDKKDRYSREADALEARIAALKAQEDLNKVRPDLDGLQIMEALRIDPGPLVGQAYKFLLDLRLEHGPMGPDVAKAHLLDWAKGRV